MIQLAPESSHPAGMWMYGALIKLSPLKSGIVVLFGSTKVKAALNKKVFVHRVKAEMAWKKNILKLPLEQVFALKVNKRTVIKGLV